MQLPKGASTYDASAEAPAKGAGKKKSGGPPPIHVHHKFIVIDGDTGEPVIYSGSPNFSASSENGNDENVLEIRGNTKLAAIYVAIGPRRSRPQDDARRLGESRLHLRHQGVSGAAAGAIAARFGGQAGTKL